MRSKRIKKVMCCAILVLALLATCCLAGCGNKSATNAGQTGTTNSGSTGSQSSGTKTSEGPEPVTMPISDKKITLTMFCILDGKAALTLQSLEENLTMQKYEELSNIDIEWYHPSSASTVGEALNIMIASNDLTDIISNITSASEGLDSLVNRGVILRLNELIDQYGYYLSKAFKDYPEFYRQSLTYDGNIALYPTARLDEETLYFESFIMRGDWLKQLNLDIPKTVDDWYTVLKAFKTKDPNNNGKDDELPFVSNSNEEMGVTRLGSLWGINTCLFRWNGTTVIDGKIKFSTETDAFDEYVSTMRKWYEEGLIDSEYVSTDATGWKEKVLTNRGGAFYGKMNGGIGTLMGSFDYSQDEDFTLIPVPYATTKDGKSYDLYSQDIFDNGGCAISAKCKHVKEAIKWLDYLYSPEGQIMASFGVEGVTFEYDAKGVPHYTELITNNPDGLSMVNAIAKYCCCRH